MPHARHWKKCVLARIRRLRGQTEVLERALQGGSDCGLRTLQQQIAARCGQRPDGEACV
ncbi:hypothetical protein [Xanthomonas albilineans]